MAHKKLVYLCRERYTFPNLPFPIYFICTKQSIVALDNLDDDEVDVVYFR